ncbi:class I SAM-dependent methyltransferase [Jeotgalibacillus marinus]|uniref:Class I SAM-dependent methyltransferase n=1 Tax=Jeotgalibacillus marinus TaxID=86667 RepID=A0ABV3Q6H0_9BACL
MAINFHDSNVKSSYSSREVSKDWEQCLMQWIGDNELNQAVDIGCGGGIYTKALAEMGIKRVTGIDFSEVMIEEARANSSHLDQVDFAIGPADHTRLPDEFADIVLERALIHHIEDLTSCFKEVHRVLRENGLIIVQDRTSEDCLLRGNQTHIRGYIFERFPHLAQIETDRRHDSQTVVSALEKVGFTSIEEIKLWETRKMYVSKDELLTDIRSRTGRSILHELSDEELHQLVGYIDVQLSTTEKIVEKDCWTVWKGIKG